MKKVTIENVKWFGVKTDPCKLHHKYNVNTIYVGDRFYSPVGMASEKFFVKVLFVFEFLVYSNSLLQLREFCDKITFIC